MRWFRGHTEAPRLLSLSPLRVDEDVESDSLHFHATSQLRDMSPVRWARRKSSGSESDRNCYNVQTSQVTTEKPSKKDKKKIQEERRKSCEKRNPLFDKVKNTRLSFFRDQGSEDEIETTDTSQFRSMHNLDEFGFMRSDFRRSVCEVDFKDITEEEKTQAKRKKRSKSHTRFTPKKTFDDQFSFLGCGSSSSSKSCWSKDDASDRQSSQSSYEHNIFLQDCTTRRKSLDILQINDNDTATATPSDDGSQFDTIKKSSCLAVKFRAMQDRYFKNSTSRLIAKIYKRDGKDKENRRLRSFSYGALPGLDELRTNPLFEDQDQDDNDSGILDNGSATSSLFDDRCSSGASGLITNTVNDSSVPPSLPPRQSSCLMSEKVDQNSASNHETLISAPRKPKCTDSLTKNSLNSLCHQAANSELIQRRIDKAQRHSEILDSRLHEDASKQLPIIKSQTCRTETMIVKLSREKPGQSLGIFIAKSCEQSPGYLVAHVVPNGLADREGTLKIGDEILIVNGKRLRGLDMSEAKRVVGCGNIPGDVDIVISRYMSVVTPKAVKSRLKESSVDYENVHVENGVLESINSPKLHFKKHSKRSMTLSKSNFIDSGPQSVSNFCTLPRRPRTSISTFHTVVFEKGPGKKSLGFTIVGGRDSPKGSIGIFIKSVLPGGQAAEDGRLRAGDEILAVNGQVSHDLTHREAVQLFRTIKNGPLALHICRRVKQRDFEVSKAKSCADLLLESESLAISR